MRLFPLLLALAAAPALAQETTDPAPELDAHGFQQAPSDADLLDLMTMWRSERQGKHAFAIEGLFEYANDLLVLREEQQDGTVDRSVLLDNLFALNLGVHYSPHERVAMTLGMPLVFTSVGADGPQGVAVGDLRLSVPVGLVLGRNNTNNGFGLSVVPFLDIPTGATGQLVGARGFSGGGIVPFGYNFMNRGSLFGNLGFTWAQSTSALNIQGGPQLLTALGGAFAFNDWIALRAEVNLRPVLRNNAVPFAESPGELVVSARYRAPLGLHVTLGGSAGITRGVGAAAYRLFLGVGYVHGKGERDRDGDGIPDVDDQCIDRPERYNKYDDEDGCPDELARLIVNVVDNDGQPVVGATITEQSGRPIGETGTDGRLVYDNLIPDQTARLTGERARMQPSYPETLELVQGDNEVTLEMKWLPGRVRILTNGPGGPVADAVASFIGPVDRPPLAVEGGDLLAFLAPGDWNVFVSAPGLGAQRKELHIEPEDFSLVIIEFNLEPAKVKVSTDVAKVELYEKVFFDTGKATIQSGSFALLDEVASTLLTHPEIRKIELQGHTDSQGGADYNRRLSQSRVDSVRTYLIERGVEPERILAVGYGEDRPLASNDTEDGRAQNRRVEISILELDESRIEQAE